MEDKLLLISIIIPIYNAEKYLDRCINSLVDQSYGNFEIILIDDGSTDRSDKICDDWVKKDSRIRVVHKKNEGVTVARKTGVELSLGEWICFVDADDLLPENALKILFSSTNENIDMVYGCIKSVGGKELNYKFFGEKSKIQYLRLLLKYQVYWPPFAKLIRRSIFDSYTFDMPLTIIIGEDFIMNLRLGQNMRKVILLPDVVYYYVWTPSSAMSKISSLDKSYKRIYINTFNNSIRPEYYNVLRGAIINFRLRRYWRRLKNKVRKIIG